MWSSSSVRVLADTVDLFDRASSRRRTLAPSPVVGLAQPRRRTITFPHVRLPQSPLQHICTTVSVPPGPLYGIAVKGRSSLLFVDLTALIETRPGVRSGKPCFVGTRIAVYDVLDYLASGMTTEQIVADFPELSEQHVRAAIEFAALRERRLASPA